MCIPIIGDDSLTRLREEYNENDKNAVAIAWDNCVSKKIVGHFPLNWSKVASISLQFTNHHIRVEVTAKRVSHDVGLDLSIYLSIYTNYIYIS